MLDKWIVSLIVSFILRQLDKFGANIDWAKVKADLEVRVRALVPGTWFDDEAVALVNFVLDRAAEVLAQKDAIEQVMKLLAAKDWQGALLVLKELLLGGWVPSGANLKKTPNGIAATGSSAADKAWKAVAAL
jgi:hypothetical protein